MTTTNQVLRWLLARAGVIALGLVGVVLATAGIVWTVQAHSLMETERELTFVAMSEDGASQEGITVSCSPLQRNAEGLGYRDRVSDYGDEPSLDFSDAAAEKCGAWRANAAARVGVSSALAVGSGVLAVVAFAGEGYLLWRRRRDTVASSSAP